LEQSWEDSDDTCPRDSAREPDRLRRFLFITPEVSEEQVVLSWDPIEKRLILLTSLGLIRLVFELKGRRWAVDIGKTKAYLW
jgi:hypothetical protein